MKKFIAILLFCLIFLHQAGFFFIWFGLVQQNEQIWQSKLVRNDYSGENLLTKSIPITFPYQADQKEYHTVDESIELNGKYFRVLKMRYARDTLHIVYVNDHKIEKIHADFNDWAKQLAQNDSENQKRNTKTLLRLNQNQYIGSEYQYQPLNVLSDQVVHNGLYVDSLWKVYLNIPDPPPKSPLFS